MYIGSLFPPISNLLWKLRYFYNEALVKRSSLEWLFITRNESEVKLLGYGVKLDMETDQEQHFVHQQFSLISQTVHKSQQLLKTRAELSAAFWNWMMFVSNVKTIYGKIVILSISIFQSFELLKASETMSREQMFFLRFLFLNCWFSSCFMWKTIFLLQNEVLSGEKFDDRVSRKIMKCNRPIIFPLFLENRFRSPWQDRVINFCFDVRLQLKF